MKKIVAGYVKNSYFCFIEVKTASSRLADHECVAADDKHGPYNPTFLPTRCMFDGRQETGLYILTVLKRILNNNKMYRNLSVLPSSLVRMSVIAYIVVFFSLPVFPIGLKVVREYPQSVMSLAKPWAIDIYDDDWTFFATQDGMIQYGGGEALLFGIHKKNSLRSVKVDREQGRVYVGGISEFGYFVPSTANSLEYVCLSDSVGDNRHIGNIWGIYPYQSTVIAQGDVEILIYDEKKRTSTKVDTGCKLDCSNFIDGILWLGTDRGLKLLMGTSVIDAPGAGELKGQRIRAILPVRKMLLVVTANNGVFRYDRNVLTRLEAASKAAVNLGEVFCADIHADMLALGSIDGGLGVVNLTSGQMTVYNESNGLPNNTVLTTKFDICGDLWVGVDPGIAKIRMTLPVETLSNKSLPIGSGYVIETVGNKMYIGTNRGLFYVDYIPGMDLSNAVFHRVEGLLGQVWGLYKTDANELLCCHDRGLFLVKGTGVVKIDSSTGYWSVQPSLRDRSKYYAGTYFGLRELVLDGVAWTCERQLEGYSGSCYNFVQESPTVVWSRDGDEGVYRLHIDPEKMRVLKSEEFLKTSDGFPLAGTVTICRMDNDIYFTTEFGIYRYDSKANEIIPDQKVGLLLGWPRSVRRLKKRGGWIYALTDKELLQADPAGLLGLRRIPLVDSEGLPVHEGDVLFGVSPSYIAYPTRRGFTFFDFAESASVAKTDEVGALHMEARINRFAVATQKDSTVFKGNFLGKKDNLVLPYSDNSIKIEYGIDDYDTPGIRYSCRLNDSKWSAPSSSRVKEFTNLREGDYVFEVKAINVDGMESVDSICFRVLPPWWRSVWAMAAYVLLVALAVWGIVLLERRRVARQQLELAREKDAEMARRQADFEWESKLKDHKIVELEKEKLDKELKHKAQEMTSVMMSLSHKNETLLTVKKELQNIVGLLPRTSADAKKAIAELQGKVTIDLKSDEVFDRVAEEFDLVHNDFIKRLRGRFPDLTNNEALMCAYLKMNLSTKEIAPLLNISVRGVETMRYRIRKKFGLEREENLTEFLSKDA